MKPSSASDTIHIPYMSINANPHPHTHHQYAIKISYSVEFAPPDPFHTTSRKELLLRSPHKDLPEHNRLGSIQKHPSIRIPPHRRRQHQTLHIRSLLHQLIRLHTMVHPRHTLLNNRPLIQIRRHEMCRRANNLDTPLIRLMIRLRALKRRQKAMMDIDNPARHGGAERRRKNLHIPS